MSLPTSGLHFTYHFTGALQQLRWDDEEEDPIIPITVASSPADGSGGTVPSGGYLNMEPCSVTADETVSLVNSDHLQHQNDGGHSTQTCKIVTPGVDTVDYLVPIVRT